MKVLIADDDPFMLRSWERTFRRLGHEVTLCPSPIEALKFFEEGYKPDIIISDLEMPGMTGDAFCKVVKERCPKVPFVLISGSSSVFDLGHLAKADQMFLKPMAQSDVLEVLRLYAPESPEST
jgi:CheY-like chemotaxis protein